MKITTYMLLTLHLNCANIDFFGHNDQRTSLLKSLSSRSLICFYNTIGHLSYCRMKKIRLVINNSLILYLSDNWLSCKDYRFPLPCLATCKKTIIQLLTAQVGLDLRCPALFACRRVLHLTQSSLYFPHHWRSFHVGCYRVKHKFSNCFGLLWLSKIEEYANWNGILILKKFNFWAEMSEDVRNINVFRSKRFQVEFLKLF